MIEVHGFFIEELREWLFNSLHGHGIQSDSPREEISPSYFVIDIYPGLPRPAREELQEIVLGFLRNLALRQLADWSQEARHHLLLVTGVVLAESSKREEAISYLRGILRQTLPPEKEHFGSLQSLIGLRDRQTAEFWRQQYAAGGEDYAPLVVEGLALIDEYHLFEWFLEVQWNDEIEAAFAGILPSLLLEYSTGRTVSALARVFPKLPMQTRERITDILISEGIFVEGLNDEFHENHEEAAQGGLVDPTVIPIPTSGHSDLQKTSPNHPLVAVAEHPHLQSLVLVRTIESWLLALLAQEHFEPQAINLLLQKAHTHLNGHDRSEIGNLIGEFTGTAEARGHLSKDQVSILAKCFFENFSDAKSEIQLAPAHFVRGRTASFANLKWTTKDVTGVLRRIYNIKDISTPARSLKKLAHKLRVDRLLIAESEFHEDRLLSWIIKAVFDEIGFNSTIAPRRWGSLETPSRQADVGLANQGHTARPAVDHAVYSYKGYYVFARRSWLEHIFNSDPSIPPLARLSLEHLLGSDPNISENEYRLGKAWLAASGGLAQSGEGFGFPEVVSLLRPQLDRVLPVKLLGHIPSPDQSFGEQFASFLKGDLDVFMGGALHASLLRRWWVPNEEIVELLSPTDFTTLLAGQWPPYDVLVLGDRLTGFLKVREQKELKASLVRLYKSVGSLLRTVAETRHRNENSAYLLDFFSSLLSPSLDDFGGREWSFVSDSEDTAHLLTIDNEFLN